MVKPGDVLVFPQGPWVRVIEIVALGSRRGPAEETSFGNAGLIARTSVMPVATPSNAVAFGSGEVSIKQMVRVGVWLNIISLVVVLFLAMTLIPLVLGQ